MGDGATTAPIQTGLWAGSSSPWALSLSMCPSLPNPRFEPRQFGGCSLPLLKRVLRCWRALGPHRVAVSDKMCSMDHVAYMSRLPSSTLRHRVAIIRPPYKIQNPSEPQNTPRNTPKSPSKTEIQKKYENYTKITQFR